MTGRIWQQQVVALSTGLVVLACLAEHESNTELARDSPQRGTFTDSRDGTTYEWLHVGSQTWMAENLDFETTTGSWCYGDDELRCDEYGRMYDWNTALSSCPDGWHLPSDEEWSVLEATLGPEPGAVLKVGGTVGFNAKMAGVRLYSGEYVGLGVSTHYWTSTSFGGEQSDHSIERGLFADQNDVLRDGYGHVGAVSVRCVKD